VKRIFHGKYFAIDQNGNESPFEFRMEVELDDEQSFTGTVWEEEFSGITGKGLTVKGFIDENHISFVKQYPCLYDAGENGEIIIDESKHGHEVIYDGHWNEELGSWFGEWEIEVKTELVSFHKFESSLFIGVFEMKVLE